MVFEESMNTVSINRTSNKNQMTRVKKQGEYFDFSIFCSLDEFLTTSTKDAREKLITFIEKLVSTDRLFFQHISGNGDVASFFSQRLIRRMSNLLVDLENINFITNASLELSSTFLESLSFVIGIPAMISRWGSPGGSIRLIGTHISGGRGADILIKFRDKNNNTLWYHIPLHIVEIKNRSSGSLEICIKF